MREEKPLHKIAGKVRGGREAMLRELEKADQPLRTRDIWKPAGVSKGSRSWYFDTLEDWGLIEEVDRIQLSNGLAMEERVFDITDRGEEMLFVELKSRSTGVLDEKFDELIDHIEEQHKKINKLEKRLDKIQGKR